MKDVETPALLLHLDVVERNLKQMASPENARLAEPAGRDAACGASGCRR